MALRKIAPIPQDCLDAAEREFALVNSNGRLRADWRRRRARRGKMARLALQRRCRTDRRRASYGCGNARQDER